MTKVLIVGFIILKKVLKYIINPTKIEYLTIFLAFPELPNTFCERNIIQDLATLNGNF